MPCILKEALFGPSSEKIRVISLVSPSGKGVLARAEGRYFSTRKSLDLLYLQNQNR